jgi:NitT/TauT family transport system substrate-binding protein
MLFRIAWFILALIALEPALAQEDQTVRVGVLRFGTVAWEIDTIRHEGLARQRAINLTPVEFASNEAAKVALQAGAVDMIVTDWPWVARQRSEGAAFSFIPYSKAVGTLMIPVIQTSEALRISRAGGSEWRAALSIRAGFSSGPMRRKSSASI